MSDPLARKSAVQLVPPGRMPRMVLFALALVLPLLITAGSLLWAGLDAGPQRLVNDSLPLTSSMILGGLAAFSVILWWFLDRAMRRQSLRLDPACLHVRTSFYSIDVAHSDLQLDAARVIDLEERTEFKPAIKTNGYALPGFKSGHFRLRNGEKTFVAIAGERRALWLPTTGKEALLLQPSHPEALLASLRELADATPRR